MMLSAPEGGGVLAPSRARVFNESLREYTKDCARRRLKSGHEYELVIRKFATFQEAHGRSPLPWTVTRDAVDEWRVELEDRLMPETTKGALSILNGWLRFFDNPGAQLLGLRWPRVETPPGIWLTVAEKRRVELVEDPRLRWIAHCGFRLGLRRLEWLNLELGDVTPNTVTVREGKGEKTATIPALSTTWAEYQAVVNWRENFVRRHAAPNTILVVRWGHQGNGMLLTPRPSWADNKVLELSDFSVAHGGRPFRSHDMRRTCARHLYEAGVAVDHIRRFLRHEKVDTTLRYIGAVFDATFNEVRGAELRELEAR